MMPKVSLVTSCYNKQDYVSTMLESVLNQTWDNMEVVIVNDGSTDDSLSVMEQWVPKLRRRGFEVTLINQENTGVSKALYNGLVNITGDYFCLPDADDLLKPEFVSTLVGILEDNPSYDVALCKYYGALVSWDRENDFGLKHDLVDFNSVPHGSLFEHYLLSMLNLSVCNCLFRYELLKASNCLFFLGQGYRVSQEPQIWLPFLNIGVNIYSCSETLYIYRTEASAHSISGRKSYADKIEALKQGKQLRDYIIEQLRPNDSKHYLQLNDICDLNYCYNAALTQNMTDDSKMYGEMLVARIHENYLSCSGCKNIYAIYRALTNKITGSGNTYISSLVPNPPTFKRIIGYGVLGTIGKKLLPLMLETDLKPTVLWDAAAKDNMNFRGIPVTLPELDEVSSDDAVLVFIMDVKQAGPLYEKLRGTKATVLYYFDILDYMAKYHFPQI